MPILSGTRESQSSGLETASNFQNGSYFNVKNSLEGNRHSAGGRHWTVISLCILRLPGKTLKPSTVFPPKIVNCKFVALRTQS